MPELPEVEYVARSLHQRVSGRRILKASLLRDRLAPHSTPAEFASSLASSRILLVHRRGKFIIFELENGHSLLVHLRMSGRFHLLGTKDPEVKFTHAVFELDQGNRLVFQDQRHFGLMKVVGTERVSEDPSIAKLAPEPFSPDFSVEYLCRTLSTSGKTLKEFLLDQSRVCGLGNIYASEAMFRAGISPLRRARNLSKLRSARLHESINDVLTEAISLTGTIVPDPVIIGEGVYGNGGVTNWSVYDREGMPCPACGRAIRRIRQGGRSTFYCTKCQR
ncbi:MAG TPA: bifunctional DNA-formamidopyrimidine glycosylase/DNA-(apurinic or apyrimidinic site) lyase [Pyrinomonadaceae bacterium]|nr:bifunctional DNA-formamidopyrimidine glycosylase/DNA-(apurinic or apyrimidinic site) lyase [Pyrinomonadaceae bacterium]